MASDKKPKKPENTHDITPDLDGLLDYLAAEQNRETVILVVDSVEVEGVFLNKSSYDFTIEITKPYQKLFAGSHILSQGRQVLSFNNEYGEKRFTETLEYLYRLGKYLSEELESLREKLNSNSELMESIKRAQSKVETLRDKKRYLRRLLKSGEIDKHEYQRQWIAEQKKMSDQEDLFYQQLNQFYGENFPMGVSYDNRLIVLNILMGLDELIS